MISTISNWIITKRRHLIGWSLFIFWETIVIGFFSGVFGRPLTYAIHYCLIIVLFYTHATKMLPWAVKDFSHSFWRVPCIVLLEMSLFFLFSFWIDQLLVHFGVLTMPGPLSLSLSYSMRELYRGFYFLGLSTGYYYLLTYLHEKKKTADLQQEHLNDIINRQKAEEEITRTQNALLIAQINPHFFFNTLDYLYHSLLDTFPDLAEAISSLAATMRFAIDSDKMGGIIRIGDEIEQVEHLIYLHQIRQRLHIRVLVDEDAADLFLIPLVILTLTENIFKHGNLTRSEDGAEIRIYVSNEILYIETENPISHIISTEHLHTGLANIGKRLVATYNSKVKFVYGETCDHHFLVKIAIPLWALSDVGSFLYPSVSTDTK